MKEECKEFKVSEEMKGYENEGEKERSEESDEVILYDEEDSFTRDCEVWGEELDERIGDSVQYRMTHSVYTDRDTFFEDFNIKNSNFWHTMPDIEACISNEDIHGDLQYLTERSSTCFYENSMQPITLELIHLPPIPPIIKQTILPYEIRQNGHQSDRRVETPMFSPINIKPRRHQSNIFFPRSLSLQQGGSTTNAAFEAIRDDLHIDLQWEKAQDRIITEYTQIKKTNHFGGSLQLNDYLSLQKDGIEVEKYTYSGWG